MEALKLSEERKYQLIDKLLDSYNYNMNLFFINGDVHYKEKAEIFLNTLKYYFSPTTSISTNIHLHNE